MVLGPGRLRGSGRNGPMAGIDSPPQVRLEASEGHMTELQLIIENGWPTCISRTAARLPSLFTLFLLGKLDDGPAMMAGAGMGSMVANVAGTPAGSGVSSRRQPLGGMSADCG